VCVCVRARALARELSQALRKMQVSVRVGGPA
jgi:hypothetical protein